jgi:glycosyltransferase involved in cell wall biosynthesis
MKIAMVGTKGIPAKWGGIEKYIEEIGKRLVERGHEVTVFGSKWFLRDFREKTYLGMRICRLPTVHFQATDALSNAFLATIALIGSDYEIVHFHGFASYYFIPLIKKAKKLTMLTVHAMESNWDNDKYNSLGKSIIKKAFHVGIRNVNCVTTVAEHLKERLEKQYNTKSFLLPSGLDEVHLCKPELIKQKYNLQGSDYILFLGRIDPIKRIDWLLDLPGILNNICLVIAGGAQDPPTETYLKSLKQKAAGNSKVIFTGPVFGKEKAELLSNCLLFVAPSENEGLPITVLEAIAYSRCCIASDIQAHSAVLENNITGFLFQKNDKDGFIAMVADVINKSDKLRHIGKAAHQHAESNFDWDKTAEQTEQLYKKLLDVKPENIY